MPGFIYGDGTYAYLRPYNLNSTEDNRQRLQLLSIDLNGPKKPNVIGKDVFQFIINTNNGVISGFGNSGRLSVVNFILQSILCQGRLLVNSAIL